MARPGAQLRSGAASTGGGGVSLAVANANMTRRVPYDEFLNDPAKYMDEVCAEPLRVEREAGSVVMICEGRIRGLEGNDPPPQQPC
jgi:hypothetical protein